MGRMSEESINHKMDMMFEEDCDEYYNQNYDYENESYIDSMVFENSVKNDIYFLAKELQIPFNQLSEKYNYEEKSFYDITDKGYALGLGVCLLISTQIIDLKPKNYFEVNKFGQTIKEKSLELTDIITKILEGDIKIISEDEHKTLNVVIRGLEGMAHRSGNSQLAGIIRQAVREFFNKINKVYLQACYIATCVYGDYNHINVIVLRKFRDEYLSVNVIGRFFVKSYYFLSPYLLGIIGNKQIFNIVMKKILNDFTSYLVNRIYEE